MKASITKQPASELRPAFVDDTYCYSAPSGEIYLDCRIYDLETREFLCTDVIRLTGPEAQSGHLKMIARGLYGRLGDIFVAPEATAAWFRGRVLVSLVKGSDGFRVANGEHAFREIPK